MRVLMRAARLNRHSLRAVNLPLYLSTRFTATHIDNGLHSCESLPRDDNKQWFLGDYGGPPRAHPGTGVGPSQHNYLYHRRGGGYWFLVFILTQAPNCHSKLARPQNTLGHLNDRDAVIQLSVSTKNLNISKFS